MSYTKSQRIHKKQNNIKITTKIRCNAFTEEINKIALSSNHDKRIWSIDSIETYVYKTKIDLICKKEEIKWNNIVKKNKQNKTKMINFDVVTKGNIKEHIPNWPQIPDHPYKVLIIGVSGYGKTNI